MNCRVSQLAAFDSFCMVLKCWFLVKGLEISTKKTIPCIIKNVCVRKHLIAYFTSGGKFSGVFGVTHLPFTFVHRRAFDSLDGLAPGNLPSIREKGNFPGLVRREGRLGAAGIDRCIGAKDDYTSRQRHWEKMFGKSLSLFERVFDFCIRMAYQIADSLDNSILQTVPPLT